MSITFSSLGFMLQTLGFKDGHSVIVCTCAAVSSMVTGELALYLAQCMDYAFPRTMPQLTKTGGFIET